MLTDIPYSYMLFILYFVQLYKKFIQNLLLYNKIFLKIILKLDKLFVKNTSRKQ